MMQPELIQLLTSASAADIEGIPTLAADPRPWPGEQGGEESGSPFTFAPRRIHLNKEHEIFEDGDIHRHLYLQNLSCSTGEADDSPKLCVSAFGCHISGCRQAFSSVEEYEHHYDSLHRHVCGSCRRSLPSARLLDLHILERHDSLFAVLAQKQDMYQCLVEGCDLRFRTSSLRKDHLIKIHKYPPDFRFDEAKKSKRTKESKSRQPRDATMEVSGGGRGGVEEGESMEVPLPQEQLASPCVPSEMSTEQPAAPSAPTHTATPEQQKPRYSYRVPSSVCFGQGSVRGFRGRGRRK